VDHVVFAFEEKVIDSPSIVVHDDPTFNQLGIRDFRADEKTGLIEPVFDGTIVIKTLVALDKRRKDNALEECDIIEGRLEILEDDRQEFAGMIDGRMHQESLDLRSFVASVGEENHTGKTLIQEIPPMIPRDVIHGGDSIKQRVLPVYVRPAFQIDI
jgi:hypothetical protein